MNKNKQKKTYKETKLLISLQNVKYFIKVTHCSALTTSVYMHKTIL